MVAMALQVPTATEVTLAEMLNQARPFSHTHHSALVTALVAHKDLPAHEVPPETPVEMDPLAKMVLLAMLVLKDPKDPLVEMAAPETRDHEATPVAKPKATLAIPVLLADLVLPVLPAPLATPVEMADLATPEARDLPAMVPTEAAMATMDDLANPATPVNPVPTAHATTAQQLVWPQVIKELPLDACQYKDLGPTTTHSHQHQQQHQQQRHDFRKQLHHSDDFACMLYGACRTKHLTMSYVLALTFVALNCHFYSTVS